MSKVRDAWPPAGVQIARRSNQAGHLELPAIPDHRVSLHLSEQTRTACRDSGQWAVRRRGHVDLIPAHSVGGFHADEASMSLEVLLPSGFLHRVATEMQIGTRRAGMEARHLIEDARLAHLVFAIEAEHEAGQPGGRLYMDSLGVALAVQLLGEFGTRPPKSRESLPAPRFQRVIDFIEANLDEPLALDELAQVAGTSSSQLQLAFKSARGTPVHRYVMERRVERARVLLIQRSMPASEIALACGFSHQSHMAHWTRRLLGATPRELLSR